MLGKLKGMFNKNSETMRIFAPVSGEAIALSMVNDETFSGELLGKGVAIRPTSGRVVSPVNGTVAVMFETGHAVSLLADNGAEVLVHVGLDTVSLKGKHYTARAKNGDKVRVGDILMEFDISKIAATGYETVTPVVICNTGDYKAVEALTGRMVQEGEELIVLK